MIFRKCATLGTVKFKIEIKVQNRNQSPKSKSNYKLHAKRSTFYFPFKMFAENKVLLYLHAINSYYLLCVLEY